MAIAPVQGKATCPVCPACDPPAEEGVDTEVDAAEEQEKEEEDEEEEGDGEAAKEGEGEWLRDSFYQHLFSSLSCNTRTLSD